MGDDEPLDLCGSDDEELGPGVLSHVPSTQPAFSSSSDSDGEDIFASAAEVLQRRRAAADAEKGGASGIRIKVKAASRGARAPDTARCTEGSPRQRAGRSSSRSASPELTASPPRIAASATSTGADASTIPLPPAVGRRKRKRSKRPRQFYGVYLLASLHPAHRRSAYIGFTVNPPRRIRQHNGEVKGGAWKTHKKRPWEMQLVLHGFPSQVVALQFEWAWQQPLKSKPMRDAMYRAGLSERGDASRKVKVLCEMLSLPPWSRYPLTLRWLKPENEAKLLRGCRPLPPNIRTTTGSVDTIDIDEMVDEDSDLEDNNDAMDGRSTGTRSGGTGGLSLLSTYGSQLSQSLGSSQDGNADMDKDAPGPRLVAALRRAGQPVGCAICGGDLSPPYAKHNCSSSTAASALGATVPMRAHLHCLALSFTLRLEQECCNNVGPAAIGRHNSDENGVVSEQLPPWVPSGGRCPTCCEERSWADWLRMSKYRFPLRRQTADEDQDEVSAMAAATAAGCTGETSESESEGEGNGYMFSDSETETEPAVAAAANRSEDMRAPAAYSAEARSSGAASSANSSDSEIDTDATLEQSLAERLGQRQRKKKKRRGPKPPSAICTLSPVVDLGDREEAEVAAEDEGDETEVTADKEREQEQQTNRQVMANKEEISLLSPSPPELSVSPRGPSVGHTERLGQLDPSAEESQQFAYEPISSEEDDETALLDSDSDCVVLMTQNPHE